MPKPKLGVSPRDLTDAALKRELEGRYAAWTELAEEMETGRGQQCE